MFGARPVDADQPTEGRLPLLWDLRLALNGRLDSWLRQAGGCWGIDSHLRLPWTYQLASGQGACRNVSAEILTPRGRIKEHPGCGRGRVLQVIESVQISGVWLAIVQTS